MMESELILHWRNVGKKTLGPYDQAHSTLHRSLNFVLRILHTIVGSEFLPKHEGKWGSFSTAKMLEKNFVLLKLPFRRYVKDQM